MRYNRPYKVSNAEAISVKEIIFILTKMTTRFYAFYVDRASNVLKIQLRYYIEQFHCAISVSHHLSLLACSLSG